MKRFTLDELNNMAQGYQSLYPGKKLILATEDGNFFFDKSAAMHHKNTQKIEMFEISLCDDNEQAEAEKQAEAKARIIECDPKELDYHEALNLLAALHKVAESRKKDDVIKAIVNLQEEFKKGE